MIETKNQVNTKALTQAALEKTIIRAWQAAARKKGATFGDAMRLAAKEVRRTVFDEGRS